MVSNSIYLDVTLLNRGSCPCTFLPHIPGTHIFVLSLTFLFHPFNLSSSSTTHLSDYWSYHTCLEYNVHILPTLCEWLCQPMDPSLKTISELSLARPACLDTSMLSPVSCTLYIAPPMLDKLGDHNPHTQKYLPIDPYMVSPCISTVDNNSRSLFWVN